MKRTTTTLLCFIAVSAAVALDGCTTGATNVTPPSTFHPPAQTLQFALGTVNFNGNAVLGLNVMATYRNAQGFTAVPINFGTLTGPTGVQQVANSADPGTATSIIFGSSDNSFSAGSQNSTYAAVDGSGVGPPGTGTSGTNPFPNQPQYGDGAANANTAFTNALINPDTEIPIYGGPPVFPSQHPASGLPGYPEGFYLIGTTSTPPTGTYTLTVSFQQNGVTNTATATASLPSNGGLSTMGVPTYTSDSKGGGSGAVVVPAGVTETIVNIYDITATPTPKIAVVKSFSTTTPGPTTLSYTVAAGTFTPGDTILVQAFGFDYDQIGLLPPANVSPMPTLPSKADVTVSGQTTATE